MNLESEDIIGYPVCKSPLDRIVRNVMAHIEGRELGCRFFACLNPHAAEMAAEDPVFMRALLDADFLTPDGIGVVYASRILGGDLSRRVTGTDVFLGVTSAMDAAGGGTCFFLGSTEETLRRIRERMAIDYPRVEVVGTLSPPFRPDFTDEDNRVMLDKINEAKPDVLWVGLTAPKQEKWLFAHRDALNVRFAGPIGAAFDFYAGNIKRVPAFWGNLGLEWLPRLLQEPRRLWRRSIVSAPRFFARTLRYRLSHRSN
jgi:N-acetylglucosaminyldiphosphoundecaprenol N-acetyl-beta-D-mannosaminyltransferase